MYKRVLLKLSGEALAREGAMYAVDKLSFIAEEIATLARSGVQCAIVVGAGNIWRGRSSLPGIARVPADHMGMLATCLNAIAVSEKLRENGIATSVFSAVGIDGYLEVFSSFRAVEALEAGRVVVLGGGTGSPFFSTDTAAVLRALEIDADCVLLAKNVAGVFTADPRKDPNARMYKQISHMECIRQDLKAADLAAMAMAHEYGLVLEVFELAAGNIGRAVRGESLGTRVCGDVVGGGVF